MYNFILQICLMIGFGGMVYLVAQGAPRINDQIEQEKKTKVDHWFSKIPIRKIDIALNNFLEKFLRRLRVRILKIDNFLLNHLNKIKSVNKSNNKKPDLLQAIITKKDEDIIDKEDKIEGEDKEAHDLSDEMIKDQDFSKEVEDRKNS